MLKMLPTKHSLTFTSSSSIKISSINKLQTLVEQLSFVKIRNSIHVTNLVPNIQKMKHFVNIFLLRDIKFSFQRSIYLCSQFHFMNKDFSSQPFWAFSYSPLFISPFDHCRVANREKDKSFESFFHHRIWIDSIAKNWVLVKENKIIKAANGRIFVKASKTSRFVLPLQFALFPLWYTMNKSFKIPFLLFLIWL